MRGHWGRMWRQSCRALIQYWSKGTDQMGLLNWIFSLPFCPLRVHIILRGLAWSTSSKIADVADLCPLSGSQLLSQHPSCWGSCLTTGLISLRYLLISLKYYLWPWSIPPSLLPFLPFVPNMSQTFNSLRRCIYYWEIQAQTERMNTKNQVVESFFCSSNHTVRAKPYLCLALELWSTKCTL